MPFSQLPFGTTAGTVAEGSDSRFPPATFAANRGLWGPTSGLSSSGASPATPTVRAMDLSDLPTGATLLFQITNPVAAASTGLGNALASNSGSNSMTGLVSPDAPRVIQALFAADWDPTINLVVIGTDPSGNSILDTIFPGALPSTASTIQAFATLTSVTKSGIGSSAGTVTIGPGSYLGLPTHHRRISSSTYMLFTNNVADTVIGIVTNSNQDPSFFPVTAPNGARSYKFFAQLL